MNFVSKTLVAPFGVVRPYLFNAERFSNTVGQFGVEPTGIECLSHGRKGFRLPLCSGEHEYEILLDNSRVKLGLIRMHQPPVTLSEGGAASQTTWDRFVQVVKEIEDK